jgi:hypothetical protein
VIDGVVGVQEVMNATWMPWMTLEVAEIAYETNKDVLDLENAPGGLKSYGLILEMQ